MNTSTLSTEELDRGWKEITLEDRTGKLQTIRLAAPSWRQAREMSEAFARSGDSWELIRPCLPADLDEKFMDRLAPSAVTELERACLLITFGEGALKKTQALLAASPATPTKDLSESK